MINITDQAAAGALSAIIVRLLQAWSKTPWITEQKQKATVIVQATIAFFASLGVGFQWDPSAHALIISNLYAANIIHLGWTWFEQWAFTHAWGKAFVGFFNGNGKEAPPELPAPAGKPAFQSPQK